MARSFCDDLIEPRMKKLVGRELTEGGDNFFRRFLQTVELPALVIEAIELVLGIPMRIRLREQLT